MGDSYRDYLKALKKKAIPQAAKAANAISKERHRIRAEHIRKSRQGYYKGFTQTKRLI